MNIANRQPNWVKTKLATAILPLSLLLGGCGDDNLDPNAINAPDVYEFASITDPSAASSVDYREATTRLILIKELEYLIGSDFLQEYGEAHTSTAVISLLNRFYLYGTKSIFSQNLIDQNLYDGTSNPTPILSFEHQLSSSLSLEQTTFLDLAKEVNLNEAMPGIAYKLNFRDKENPEQGHFIGWNLVNAAGDNLPDAMIQDWFSQIAMLATDGDATTKFIKSGIDYQQLISTFLLGAIAYGQASNMHLNPQAGLSENNAPSDGQAYSNLQHQWDLAFGYYGAVKHANTISNSEIIKSQDHNYTGDTIDLGAEFSYEYASNAPLRDLSSPMADTNISQKTIQSFLNGRQLIDDNMGSNSDTFSLNSYAQQILKNWEDNIAMTFIHHLNFTALYALYYPSITREYAYYWSKMKAYALSLQFSPNSTLTADQLSELHVQLGKYPEINTDNEGAKIVKYSVALSTKTRAIIENAFKYSNENASNW